MKRGEVYMADLDPVIGSEQGGTRPVLIIQNDQGNRHGTTVIVAALTAKPKKPGLPTHVSIPKGQGGLWRDSTVLTEQLRTIERTRLGQLLGEIPPEAMRRVNRALILSLDAAETPAKRNA